MKFIWLFTILIAAFAILIAQTETGRMILGFLITGGNDG